MNQSGKIGARKKTNNKWFELQDSIGYWEDFFRPKIVWARLMRISKNEVNSFPRFTLIPENIFIMDSLCFFVGQDLFYLQGVLNSEFAAYFFFNNITILDNGGMQMRQQYVEYIPIPKCDWNLKTQIEELVLEINSLGNRNDRMEIINNAVYQAFEFTDKEKRFIKEFVTDKFSEIKNKII